MTNSKQWKTQDNTEPGNGNNGTPPWGIMKMRSQKCPNRTKSHIPWALLQLHFANQHINMAMSHKKHLASEMIGCSQPGHI